MWNAGIDTKQPLQNDKRWNKKHTPKRQQGKYAEITLEKKGRKRKKKYPHKTEQGNPVRSALHVQRLPFYHLFVVACCSCWSVGLLRVVVVVQAYPSVGKWNRARQTENGLPSHIYFESAKCDSRRQSTIHFLCWPCLHSTIMHVCLPFGRAHA